MPILILSLLSPINDITTSFNPVVQFVKPLTYQESFKEVQLKLYPDLKPLEVNVPAALVFETAVSLAKQEPQWEVTIVDPQKLHLEAVATTALLKFKDDLVIEVKSLSDGKSQIQMRSRSRVGRSDLGANAKRIQSFFDKIKNQFESRN